MLPPRGPVALTIGNFDGVHRGHRALLTALMNWKRSRANPSEVHTLVVTFDPHPSEIITGTSVPRLTTPDERRQLMLDTGIDEVTTVPFTHQLAATDARAFFDEFIRKRFEAKFVAVGHDFFFGRKREGTPEKLLAWCFESGIEAVHVDPIEADGSIISSTRIRRLIEDGSLVAANRLLGRAYSITGEVVHGDKRGRQIGFPTANIVPPADGHGRPCLPARGVYLSTSTVDGRTFPSITNIGVKPTVSASGLLVIETHLIDFDGDLYGKQLTVEFSDRLREEKKFPNLQALVDQIREDTQLARSRLTRP